MRKNLLFFIFLFSTIISFNIYGQSSLSMVRFDPPSFVPFNKNFSTSIIFKVNDYSLDPVIIKFKKPGSLKIISAKLNYGNFQNELNISLAQADENEVSLAVNREEIDLAENIPYQIILECFSKKPQKIQKRSFSWINSEVVTIPENFNKFGNQLDLEETQSYEVQSSAGNSILFKKSSKLEYKLSDETNWEKIYAEYWIKSDHLLTNYFSIEKSLTNDTIISFSKSIFGFLSFPLHENELTRNDVYLGDNSWNYVGVLLSNSIQGLRSDVYVNSRLAYSIISHNNFDLKNLNFILKNNSDKAKFEIDRLKIWKFNNNIDLALDNKHFLTFEADSSQLIYQSNFDNVGEFNSKYETESIKIVDENLEYVKSNAPIFSKSPKLTVNIGNSYNSIVWYVQEYSVAKEFVIERAIGDGDFEIVFKTFADNDPLKIYYFTDQLIDDNVVVYYRVRQINNDESEVFSAEVKIGHKEAQEFILSQNYPNPFNPITSIYVEVVLPTEFEVNVYDLVGTKVSQLYDGFLTEGMHTFEFDGSSLPSGIYFYEVISPKAQNVKKMILAK